MKGSNNSNTSSFFYSILKSMMSIKFWYRFLTIFAFLIVLLGTVIECIKAKSGFPFIWKFGGLLAGADNGLNEAITSILGLQPVGIMGFFTYMYYLILIFASIWLVFIWYYWVMNGLKLIMNQSEAYFTQFFIATIILVCLHEAYLILSIYFNGLVLDLTTLDGAIQLVPFLGGFIRFGTNITAIFSPLLGYIYSIPFINKSINK